MPAHSASKGTVTAGPGRPVPTWHRLPGSRHRVPVSRLRRTRLSLAAARRDPRRGERRRRPHRHQSDGCRHSTTPPLSGRRWPTRRRGPTARTRSGWRTARARWPPTTRRPAPACDPDRVVLTASTSEAYGFLFKLLCDPGDDVLVPVPSYPAVRAPVAARCRDRPPVPARLPRACGRSISRRSAGVWPAHESRAGGDAEQPDGVVRPARASGGALRQLCAARRAALICDEVFLDYPLEPAEDAVRGVRWPCG